MFLKANVEARSLDAENAMYRSKKSKVLRRNTSVLHVEAIGKTQG
jgi:hypothetical protein